MQTSLCGDITQLSELPEPKHVRRGEEECAHLSSGTKTLSIRRMLRVGGGVIMNLEASTIRLSFTRVSKCTLQSTMHTARLAHLTQHAAARGSQSSSCCFMK